MSKVDKHSLTFLKMQTIPQYADFIAQIGNQEDLDFIFRKTSFLPDELLTVLLKKAFKENTAKNRNLFILRSAKKIQELFPVGLRGSNIYDDIGIRNKAEWIAKLAQNKVRNFDISFAPKSSPKGRFPSSQSETSSENRFANTYDNQNIGPKSEISHAKSALKVYQNLTEFARNYGVKAPLVSRNGATTVGAIKRMLDPKWWKKKIGQIITQCFDHSFRILGKVHQHAQIYVSNRTVSNRRRQLLENEEMLNRMVATNNAGQSFTLSELSKLNVSNPQIRKNELMVRTRGFEDYAKEHNHQAVFVTLTCPSKYHAAYALSGDLNPKFAGFTPYQGQQYLNKNWQQIRAELSRNEIRIYGMRVVEPQHDGTPHWHLLLFMQESYVEQFKKIVHDYSLKEDGDEKGAQENRVDFKEIDPEKGSATGYIAKYISKNIDGEGLEEGFYGEDPKNAAKRVEAWASCWHIRQFQQIGGASVTVWRELRRLKQNAEHGEFFERVRSAADKSNWREFNTLLNAIDTKRKEHPIKPAYDVSFDPKTGEVKTDRYDGKTISKLKGLIYEGKKIISRMFTWKVEVKPVYLEATQT